MTQKTCITQHVRDFYFIVHFCDLTLTLTYSGMTFVLMHYPFQTFISTFCAFELLAARPTDHRAQNVKALFLYF